MSTPLITPTVRQNGVAQISLSGPHKSILLLSLLSAAPRLALLLFMGVAGVRVAQAFRNQIGDPWPDLAVSLPLLVLLFAAGIILLATAEIIDRRWHPPTEYIRKFAHIGAGAIAFFAPVFFSTHLPVFVLAIMFSVALLAGRRLGWLASLPLLRPAHPGRAVLGSRPGWTLVWIAVALSLLVVAKNSLATPQYQGRFLFPSIGALSLLATAGWMRLLSPRVTRFLPQLTLGLMIGLNLFTWFSGLIPTYYQPFLDGRPQLVQF